MNTVQIWQTVSTGSDETQDLAMAMGRKLRGGEVIELVSDIGGGKTTFVRGLAKGIGSHNKVHSPSFTLANEYKGRKLKLFHLDLYRLNTTGVLKDEISEFMVEPNSVIVIEWPQLVDDVLPAERLTINIRPISETDREIRFEYQDKLSYLFPVNT
jgi:tRNA threonylcarbamoyladenosine biosynthesis protein TsaE